MAHNFIPELTWRGLLHQSTHPEELELHLAQQSRRIYIGFDPTADSLTLGNLVPLLLLRHAQQAGHTPIVVMGGATGLIGDPSGKSTERPLLNKEHIEANIAGQRTIFEQFLDFSGDCAAQVVNNADWLLPIRTIDFLRDIGKHFSVNAMIQRDSVRERLHNRDQGISYTEFSYMLLQAYDFFYLAKHHQVSLQMGGSDQFGNIVSGCDLIRRLLPGTSSFGLTAPLLLKADGSKFGKSEQGALWLTKERTSPYHLYQYFLNMEDQEVIPLLKKLTFLTHEEIWAKEQEMAVHPEKRPAQKSLAYAVVNMLHGREAAQQAERATEILFSGEINLLSKQALEEIFAHVPRTTLSWSLFNNTPLPIIEILLQSKIVSSKREARELLQANALLLNGKPATPETKIDISSLLYGSLLVVRKGKKHWHLIKFLK